MPTRILQQRFTQGEFSPEMLGRSDVDQYYSGAETLQNVEVIPQGGLRRRAGLERIDTLRASNVNLVPSSITAVNGGTTANADDDDTTTVLLTTTNVSTTNPYVVVQYDMGADVQIEFVDIANIFLTVSGTSTSDFFIEVATAAAPTTWIPNSTSIDLTTTGFSTRRGVVGTFRHIRLAKTTATDLSTNRVSLTEMNVFNNVTSVSETREMPFEFNKTQTYNMVFTDRNIAVYKGSTFQVNIPAPEFTSARLSEINWTQSADTGILVHADIPPHKLIRNGSDTAWTFNPVVFDTVPQFDYTPASSNPAGTITPSSTSGVITLTASATPFTDEATDVGQIVDGGGGRARVIQFLTTATVKAVTIIPFFDTTAITSGAWVYETGFEDVWSVTRGWPKSCTFHSGRLWFGGSSSRPQTLWGSKVGLFFDYDPGQIFDDDAIDVTLDTDQVNGIVNLFSAGALQIFTTGGEFATFQGVGVAITPSNIDIRRQTQEGSTIALRPVEIDGGTIYVKRGGGAIIEFIFDDLQQSYTSNSVTLLSSHLIITPVDIAVDKSNSSNDAALLYVVNSDGTMAVGAFLKAQKVIAFTEYVSSASTGLIKNVVVDETGVWLVIERTLNSVTNRYLEKFDENLLMDSAFSATGAISSVTGVTWLANETIKLRVDGVNVDDVTVSSGGVVTISPASTTSIEFGLNFTTTIKDLPVEISPNTVRAQSTFGKKKRISGVQLRLLTTSGMKVNGNEVTTPIFTAVGTGSNAAIADFSGVIRLDAISDYSELGQLTITQAEPNPLTLLAVTKKVNF